MSNRGFDIVLGIIEEALDEALDRAAHDPDSIEAREEVAEWERQRRNLLRAESEEIAGLPRPRFLN
jgi:hypothetical protein